MKVFISQPMKDKTEQEIKIERDLAMDTVASFLVRKPEFIDNYFNDAVSSGAKNDEAIAIIYLARSIELMAQADVAFFCKGWEQARGCRIEHAVAKDYGITIIEEGD